MPTTDALRTAPAIQGAVIALRAQGASKRKVARELGITPRTVDRVLTKYSTESSENISKAKQLIPKAFQSVEKALDAGDAQIGIQYLKLTEFAPQSTSINVAGDLSVQQAINLLPARPAIAATAELPAIDVATTATTEAPKNPADGHLNLSSHTNFSQNQANFSQFSTEELEAELARRRAK